MPFVKNFKTDFKLENNQIILSDEYLEKNKAKFKKITGSRFAAVLNMNDFNSPVKAWAMMVGIYTEPMDETLANVGNIIEPKIREYVEKQTNIKYKQYNPFQVNFDVFSNNKIFGGIPDGEPLNKENEVDYSNAPMLEIKTTSIDSFVYKKVGTLFELQKDENNKPLIKSKGTKKEKWFDSNGEIIIPTEYKMQLGLYCYLRNITNGIFAVCFLETDDYAHPLECNVYNRDIKLVDFNVNLDLMKNLVLQAENWYKQFIETGKSPVLTEKDLEWFNTELNSNEW